jgi:uncharacterized membrane protein YdjX (TVP38/TMEM64 family)
MKPTKITSTGQLLATAQRYTLLTYLAGVLLLAAIVFLVGDETRHYVAKVEAWIRNLGPWGVLVFLGLFVVATSLLVPESVMSIMAGVMFGLSIGLITAVAGNLLAAALQYGLSREILRKRIELALASRPPLAALRRAVSRNELRLQALVRLIPLNPATISYMLGALGVRFAWFLLACLAFIPHMFIEVYFGYAAKHVVRMTDRATPEVSAHDVVVIAGLVVTIFVTLFVSARAHKAVMKAVSGVGSKTMAASE